MRRAIAGALIASLMSAPAPTRAAAARPPLNDRAPAALRVSSVAVLLPQSLPRSIGPIRSITVIRAGRDGYYVGYSTIAHCAGALSCASVHVAGFPAALSDPPSRRDRPIILADGTRATFRPEDCSGASCTEASLTFARAEAFYEIDAKVNGDDLTVLESIYRFMRPVNR